jgi:hypothetical protein
VVTFANMLTTWPWQTMDTLSLISFTLDLRRILAEMKRILFLTSTSSYCSFLDGVGISLQANMFSPF